MLKYQIYYLSLAAAVMGSIAMAALLWFKSGRRDVVKPLVLFCLGVAAWVSGYLLLAPGISSLLAAGRFLINLSSLVAAFFLHFALRFSGKGRPSVVYALYAVAAATTATALFINAGRIEPWLEFRHFYRLDRGGISLALVTGLYSAAAHLVLLGESVKAEGKRQRQMLALFASGGWGLLSASGFVFESIGLNIFPYPVLLLPFYTILLAYGVLRYELMEINVWARKAVAWAMVLFIPILAVSIIAALFARYGLGRFSEVSLWSLWLFGLAVLLLSVLIRKPASLIAERIVYPGMQLTTEKLRAWQGALESAGSWEELSVVAQTLLSKHMGFEVAVAAAPHMLGTSLEKPALRCGRENEEWRFIHTGWEDAAPAALRTLHLFGALLAAASARLDALLKIAEREKAALVESHLTDLGRLSATVAHELRNPLNVISMASAGCSAEIKKEIGLQLERSQKLIDDLLAYSGSLKIERKRLCLKEEAEYILSHYKDKRIGMTIDMPDDLFISFDPHRLHQVFFNLLDNAVAALQGREKPEIRIKASESDQGVNVVFANNGPEIPEEIAAGIFRPFVSGRRGGSGLGLAIVKRIMEAHGGKIELAGKDDGACRFELLFTPEG